MIAGSYVHKKTFLMLLGGILIYGGLVVGDDDKTPRLTTRWGEQVTAENVHPEYPRPQMTRPRWKSLNGKWDYAILPRGDKQPAKYQGKLLVPFPVESTLSGVRTNGRCGSAIA